MTGVDWKKLLDEFLAHRRAGGTFISENPVTISEVSGYRAVKRPVTFDERTFRVFQRVADTLFELDANPPTTEIVYNGVKATPIGLAEVLPLPVAIDWARLVQQMSASPLPCDFCERGDGRFGLARVDHGGYAFIARVCEACDEIVYGTDLDE